MSRRNALASTSDSRGVALPLPAEPPVRHCVATSRPRRTASESITLASASSLFILELSRTTGSRSWTEGLRRDSGIPGILIDPEGRGFRDILPAGISYRWLSAADSQRSSVYSSISLFTYLLYLFTSLRIRKYFIGNYLLRTTKTIVSIDTLLLD